MVQASSTPETGCTMTAPAVKSASAITTMRAVAVMAAASRVRCAIHIKKAMPRPVPNSTAAPSTWTSLSVKTRSITALHSSFFEDREREQRRHQHRHDLGERSERIGPELGREQRSNQDVDRGDR